MTQICLTTRGVSTTSLAQYCLSTICSQPSCQWCEGGINVVSYALGMGSGVIRVEIFVYVEDQIGGSAVEIGDLRERRGATVGDEGACGCVLDG